MDDAEHIPTEDDAADDPAIDARPNASTPARSPRRPSARGGRPIAGTELSPHDLAAACLRVVAAHGAHQLTRARVAEELGVSTRALYRLAPTADHLVAAAGAQWQERWTTPPETGDWVADLRSWCLATLRHASAHPGLTAATQRVPVELLDDRSERVVTAVTSRLVDAGFVLPDALQIFGVLSMHCLGWAVVFAADVPVPRPPDDSSTDASPEWLDEHLEFRRSGFELGLDLLLDGLRSRAPRRSPARFPRRTV